MRLWLKLSLFNLLIVSSLGVVLRYKIAYSLPFVDQKFLLHAHSHFAFTGWITQTLMVLMVQNLVTRGIPTAFKQYNPLLLLNALSAYGMLLSFPFQGYGAVSIAFSTLSILVFFAFAYCYTQHLKSLPAHPQNRWLYTSLLFNVFSAIGTFYLAYLMIGQSGGQKQYLSAIYFFLHFQYNGWFFFASMGLLTPSLLRLSINVNYLNSAFWIFFAACIPGYLLSVLWLPMPNWIYWIVVLSAVLPVFAWGRLWLHLQKSKSHFSTIFEKPVRWLLAAVSLALTIKLLLQAGSVIPALSKISYTYRPIIIGYLHLILLGIFTLFLLAQIIHHQLLFFKRLAYVGLIVFTVGIVLNELVLMLQGGSYMNYVNLPYTNEVLLAIAATMSIGLLLITTGTTRKKV
ncbi:MAG: hypothetical protein KF880_05200 [Ferruginibacter sp.]|nr:hypothetical protein [Ferruginibacter sp.]